MQSLRAMLVPSHLGVKLLATPALLSPRTLTAKMCTSTNHYDKLCIVCWTCRESDSRGTGEQVLQLRRTSIVHRRADPKNCPQAPRLTLSVANDNADILAHTPWRTEETSSELCCSVRVDNADILAHTPWRTEGNIFGIVLLGQS